MSRNVTENLDGTRPAKGVSAIAAKEGGGFPNPGLPPHAHRQADHDRGAEKRAEQDARRAARAATRAEMEAERRSGLWNGTDDREG